MSPATAKVLVGLTCVILVGFFGVVTLKWSTLLLQTTSGIAALLADSLRYSLRGAIYARKRVR